MQRESELEGSGYYERPRHEVMPHLPARAARILDIGCGAGATIELVKAARQVQWAGGVELSQPMAERARRVCDRVWSIDIEREKFEEAIAPGSLDLVMCMDVLEHLVDPWDVVRRLATLLAPGGRLIVSVPNIRHWKFIARLAFKGDFHYTAHGLLDRTHLRFFVRSTAIDLARSGGLHVIADHSAQTFKATDPRRWVMALSGGRLVDLFAKQWVVVAEKR